MMMRMLEAGGLEVLTDGVRQADADNPNGYYELERAKALARGDRDWLPEARGRVVKVVSPLLRYLPDDQHYRVILMRRDMDEVLASQERMLERRGEPTRSTDHERLGQLFAEDLRRVESWADERANVACLEVSYNRLVADPADELHRIAEFLGDRLDAEAMTRIVDPALYRQRKG